MNSVDGGKISRKLAIVAEPALGTSPAAGAAKTDPARQPLPDGTTLGPYRIHKLIASGGMGDVYRARDERLGRDIALKVLPNGLTNDRERVERFAQEAKSASALNHPHIVAIYEIGQARPSCNVQPISAKDPRPFAEDVHYIAMELVDGETLREFLAGDPSLTRRLEVLAQTAEGLGKAHAAGIVHRDLKPDNVMVSGEGYAKVVDFGLAKLAEPAQGWNPLGADSPTMRALTQQGELIGTAGYMSPEQILGRAVDQRSDIFSFGCIVHEAVTGRKPFEGDSFIDTLHEVLHGTPTPIQHSDERAQHELQRIVGKCLVKDRENRYQSIRDVALDLRALGRELEAPIPIASRRPAIKRRWLGAAAAAIVVVLAIAAIFAWRAQRSHTEATALAAPRHNKLQRLTSNGRVGRLAISPDGRFAAYSIYDDEKGPSVWLHQIATGSSVSIMPPTPKAYFAGLTFSADSNFVIPTRYVGSIYGTASELPILGGTPSKLIGDADTAVSVSPDGTQLAFARDVLEKGESRVLVTARDGSHERVVGVLPLPRGARSPAWSPDGKQIAVTHAQNVYLIDAAHSTMKNLPLPGWHGSISDLAWTPAGDALIVSAVDERSAGHSQLLRVDLVSGAMTSVTEDSDDYSDPHVVGSSIAAVQTKRQATLWSLVPGAAPEQLTRGLGTSDGLGGVAWTRDQHIVYTSTAAGSVDLWIANADGSAARQLSNSDMIVSNPVVTPDGTTIVYCTRSHGQFALWKMNVDGSQRRQIVPVTTTDRFVLTPDSKRLVYAMGDAAHHNTSLMIVPLEGGTPTTIATTGVFLKSLELTPDGTAVVFSALDETAIKLFRVALNGGPVTKLTTERALDGDVSPDGKLVVCTYGMHEVGGKAAIVPIGGGAPLRILDLDSRLYSWTRDGKGIMYVKRDGKTDVLYLLPLAGGAPKALTNFAEGMIANYEWSPDAKRILLTHYVEVRDAVMLSGDR
jgi:serine/threonine protein kinase/Tol biopolymer transport system component